MAHTTCRQTAVQPFFEYLIARLRTADVPATRTRASSGDRAVAAFAVAVRPTREPAAATLRRHSSRRRARPDSRSDGYSPTGCPRQIPQPAKKHRALFATCAYVHEPRRHAAAGAGKTCCRSSRAGEGGGGKPPRGACRASFMPRWSKPARRRSHITIKRRWLMPPSTCRASH